MKSHKRTEVINYFVEEMAKWGCDELRIDNKVLKQGLIMYFLDQLENNFNLFNYTLDEDGMKYIERDAGKRFSDC